MQMKLPNTRDLCLIISDNLFSGLYFLKVCPKVPWQGMPLRIAVLIFFFNLFIALPRVTTEKHKMLGN